MTGQTAPEDILITAAEIQAISNRAMDTALAADLAWSATSAVRDHCRWRVAKTASEAFRITPRSRGVLTLPSLHVASIVSIAESDAEPLIEGTDFEWFEHGTVVRIRGSWNRHRPVAVTITHGYEECPGGIAQSIASAVARGALAPSGNVVSETTLSASLSFGRGPGGTAAGLMFLPHELERLNTHRIGASR